MTIFPQMASMQEEVRQLREINDDFLEDHARYVCPAQDHHSLMIDR